MAKKCCMSERCANLPTSVQRNETDTEKHRPFKTAGAETKPFGICASTFTSAHIYSAQENFDDSCDRRAVCYAVKTNSFSRQRRRSINQGASALPVNARQVRPRAPGETAISLRTSFR